jgi:hypothetical protein
MAAATYRQQKVLSHFPVCCWTDWLLMIKNCLIESGPPCISQIMHDTVQRGKSNLNHTLEHDDSWRNSFSAVGQLNHKYFSLNAIILGLRAEEPRLCICI